MSDYLQAVHFVRPHLLWMLLPLFLSYFWLRRAAQQQAALAPAFLPIHLARVLTLPAAASSRLRVANLIHAMLLLAIVAIAGPSWQRAPNPLSGDESNLLIALDVSASMARNDVQPTRLERAKQKISDLLATRPGSFNALIVYAGSAHQVIPLTDDASIVNNFLQAVDHYVVPNEGKNPAAVLPIAQQLLAENISGNAPGMGTLLMVGDAVPQAFLAQARDWIQQQPRAQMLVWGMGEDDEQQDSLKRLADAVDSYYRPMTIDKADVNALQWRIRNALYVSAASDSDWHVSMHYLLWPLALLLLLAFRPGGRLFLPLLLLVFLPLAQPLYADESATPSPAVAKQWYWLDILLTRDQQGMLYLRMGQAGEAARRFNDPAWRGVAHYRAEGFAAAADNFRQIDALSALYNEANALAHGQHYIKALRVYDKLLQRAPAHSNARHNRALIQALVDEIDAMSESQAAESGEEAFELGDEPQRGHGAEREDTATVDEQYSAEQLLADERIRTQWMQRVQADPGRFLAAKFAMQAAEQDDAP